MAHFLTYVLVSGSTKDVRERVRFLMTPYHNEFEVEEYETECDCAGQDQTPDPDCEDCGGTGKYFTTFNPMCMFDFYAIWDSQHVLPNASKNPSDWEEEEVYDDHIPDDDGAAIAPLSSLNIERLKLPYAVVTPSGDWHEMPGDWYSEDRASADWQEWGNTAKEIFEKYANAILVVLNCHR
jgi:hypothetical protein